MSNPKTFRTFPTAFKLDAVQRMEAGAAVAALVGYGGYGDSALSGYGGLRWVTVTVHLIDV